MRFLFYNLFKRIKGSNILSCPNSTGYETFFVFQFCLEVQTKLKVNSPALIESIHIGLMCYTQVQPVNIFDVK